MTRVLVAGIGNIFFGDDGFGVEVANRLNAEAMPDGVRCEDFGIRGVHLAYELLDGYDALVLIDALPMGEPPGTVAVVEPDRSEDLPVMDAHSMSPAVVLAMIDTIGAHVDRIRIIGCQPAEVVGIGLSPPVAASIDRAVQAVHETLDELLEVT
jgi:hydrogenase maturation protease